jgi:hypothetical protein
VKQIEVSKGTVPPSDRVFITREATAKRLRVKPRTLDAWVRRGIVPQVHITGKVNRFHWASVFDALVARGRKP